jgi:hypothetical protein
MKSTDIVGYAYDAALHCPDCTHEAMLANAFRREPPLKVEMDQHGIALDLIDSEGNPVTPVFCGEDAVEQPCDDCGTYLMDDKPAERMCIVDGCFGIYVPTRFAAKFRNNDAYCVLHVTPADWDELEKGPNEPDYWELWDEICQEAEIIDNETGVHYMLEQDGDLFMVRK